MRRARALALLLAVAGCAHAPETGIDWVTIGAGSFTLGSKDGAPDRRPPHAVALRAFQMARTLTTKAQYARCVDAGRCAAPRCQWPAKPDERDFPVVCVSWEEARAYSEWAGGRLPSESEWEYAARSEGKPWSFPWGDEKTTCARARAGGCGYGAVPVCSRPSGNTLQGLCDMTGEVWEWTADGYHASYEGAPPDGSAWENPAGTTKVNRGGSWDFDERPIHAYDRNQTGADARSDDLGFRPARSLR